MKGSATSPAQPPAAVQTAGLGTRWWRWALAVVVVAIVAAVAALNIQARFALERAQTVLRLESMAELRASQVETWVGRQLRLAHLLDGNQQLADLYLRWQDRADADSGSALLKRVVEYRQANDADGVLVVDAAGRVLASEAGGTSSATSTPELQAAVASALRRGSALNTPIHRSSDALLPLRMDVVVPLLKTGTPTRGAVVLRLDPQRALFPLLAGWPVPSSSAETLLWQRQGSTLLNANAMRRQPGNAGRLVEPLATSTLPVARVLRGALQPNVAVAVQDTSQPHRPQVMAAVRAVQGTDWWVSTQIDVDEMEAPARWAARSALLAAGALLLGAALGWRIWLLRRTALRQRHERLESHAPRQALALLEAIAQSSQDAIFAKDLDGRYIFCNPAAGAAVGLAPAAVIGRRNEDLFDPATAAQINANDLLALRGELPEVLEVLPTAQGEIHVLSTKAPLHGADGKLMGMVGVGRDVTEKRRTERALRDSEAHYRSVVAVLNEGVLVSDPQGRVLSCNPAAERIVGAPQLDWQGRSVIAPGWVPLRPDGSAMPPEETPPGMVLAGHPAQHGVLLATRSPDGDMTWFEVNAVPVPSPDTDALLAVVTSFSNVTRRRRMEQEIDRHRHQLEMLVAERTQALQRSNEELALSRDQAQTATRAKSAFLANMSHEIRTPMNAIIGLTHLLSRDVRDPLQLDRLGKVGHAAQHLLQVINDILDLSKIEAGKLTLDDSEFSLDMVLSRVLELVSVKARDKGLELILDTDHMPRRLRGDATRLAQILINLLSNAVKFTEHGWVRLRGELLATHGRRVQLRFEVHDTGPGIARERQAELFTAFEQADNATSRLHGGSGLGLALSRQLAVAMEGDAGVVSAPGSGSTFWFTVWMARGAEAGETAAPVGTQGLRALLVDDLPEALAVIRERLQMLGLQVDAVGSGPAALTAVGACMAAGRPYDVMLIDWRMEPMDGIQTLTALRQLLGDGTPPSIMITAADDPGLLARATSAYYDAVLLKPMTASALQDTLVTVLRQQAQAATPHSDQALDGEVLLRLRHAGQRVLLAEDNPINREVAEELLRAAGLVVESAWNGVRAVELALSRPYDLILMDMQMPVIDGLEATRSIREQAGRATPIVAMTANAFVEDRAACLDAGMNDHVSKPVDPTVMYATLLRWLPLRAPAPAAAAEPTASAPADKAPLRNRLAGIAGFDIDVALRNVGGQLPILVRVLRRFVATYGEGLPLLLQPPGNDAEAALTWRGICHSLRGALGTVGMTTLIRDVAALERDLAEPASCRDSAARGQHIHDSLLVLVQRVQQELDA